MAIFWYGAANPAIHQEIPTGLRPRNDRGNFQMVLLVVLGNCPARSAGWCSAQRIINPMIAGGNHTLIQVTPPYRGR